MAAIDRKLNLVVPVDSIHGALYVHSTPISRPVFEKYYSVIAKTFSTLYGGGYGVYAGPRVAALILRETAQSMGVWEGTAGVESGLVGEIKRLSLVLVPAASGWTYLPWDDAIREGKLSEEDAAEVFNALTFFTVASSMHTRRDLPGILSGASKLWGGLTTPLLYTEYAASLPKPTEAANTGAKVLTPSSLPS